jgi:hypothetical protein
MVADVQRAAATDLHGRFGIAWPTVGTVTVTASNSCSTNASASVDAITVDVIRAV